MRVKTHERRQKILKVATEVFQELGYARASMSAISARIGGSKGTLYGYFKSKEELFIAAMLGAMKEANEVELVRYLDPEETDIALALRRFGAAYLHFVTQPDFLSLRRTAIAEGDNSRLGVLFYENGPKYGWEKIVTYLTALRERGVIRPVDPHVAAQHLKALFEAGIVEPLLFGAVPEFARQNAVDAAVDIFLRAYGAPVA